MLYLQRALVLYKIIAYHRYPATSIVQEKMEDHCSMDYFTFFFQMCHVPLPMSLAENSPPPKDAAAAAAATSSPPPIDVIKADRPLLGLPPAAIPNPRKSRVVCFGPNIEGVPIINSFNPEPPSQCPSPSPAGTEAFSGSTCRWLQCKLSCCPDEDEDETMPNPRSNDAFVAAAPIWAAFCSSAVADMAGCGDGAYCRRSCPAVPKIDDPWLVERQREMGSVEEGRERSVGGSGRPIARIRSVNAGVWAVCKLADAVEEANRLANTLQLALPLLLELVVLAQLPFRPVVAGASFTICGGFSGNSTSKAKREKRTQKRLIKNRHRHEKLSFSLWRTLEGKGVPIMVSFL